MMSGHVFQIAPNDTVIKFINKLGSFEATLFKTLTHGGETNYCSIAENELALHLVSRVEAENTVLCLFVRKQ